MQVLSNDIVSIFLTNTFIVHKYDHKSGLHLNEAVTKQLGDEVHTLSKRKSWLKVKGIYWYLIAS